MWTLFCGGVPVLTRLSETHAHFKCSRHRKITWAVPLEELSPSERENYGLPPLEVKYEDFAC
jgi:hypothetical protein